MLPDSPLSVNWVPQTLGWMKKIDSLSNHPCSSVIRANSEKEWQRILTLMQFFESEWSKPFILLDDVVRVFYKQPKWWKTWKIWRIRSTPVQFAPDDKIKLEPVGVSGNLSPQCLHSGVNRTKKYKLIIIYEQKADVTWILRKWLRFAWGWEG
jgi:hypothetical protein